MPCYQVNTMSVEFRAENRPLLDAALRELEKSGFRTRSSDTEFVISTPAGDRIEIDLAQGEARVWNDATPALNQIKREYSRQALQLAARQKGWILRQDTKNENAGQIVRY